MDQWRQIVAAWPDEPVCIANLKAEVQQIAATPCPGAGRLSAHPQFFKVVQALDRLLMREADVEVDDFLRSLLGGKYRQLFDAKSWDPNAEDAFLRFMQIRRDQLRCQSDNFSVVHVELMENKLEIYSKMFLAPPGTTPGDLMEYVASEFGRDPSQLIPVNVRQEDLLRPIPEVFAMTLAVRPDDDDYQDDINSWPEGPGKKTLVRFLMNLERRPLPESPGGCWGSTAEFAKIVRSLTTVLAPRAGTRGICDDPMEEEYEQLLNFLESESKDVSPKELVSKLEDFLG